MIAFLTALPAILGALAGMVPAIMQWLTLKETNAQQIRLEELRQAGRRQEVAGQVDIANAQADQQQSQHIYDFGSAPSGYKFVDALAVVVRPYITMVFFHFWVAIKVALFIYGVNSGYNLGQLAKLIWDETDTAVFSAIMGFWFGNRMMTRSMAATLAVTTTTKGTAS
jgi:hypothetical protein